MQFVAAHYAQWVAIGVVVALATAVVGAFVKTPYGRFASGQLGPQIPIRLGWIWMEFLALPVFFACFLAGSLSAEPVPMVFAAVWTLHYANRSIYFPLAMRARPDSRMGVGIPLIGMLVVGVHAALYGTWLGELGAHLTVDWLRDPRFWIGAALYLSGQGLVLRTEAILRGLRKPGDTTRYRIPFGAGYRWVSSPHYLGELMAWSGLAIATWCPGGLFVLLMSCANLIPRALATHRWYRETFTDYPPERRAILPFVL